MNRSREQYDAHVARMREVGEVKESVYPDGSSGLPPYRYARVDVEVPYDEAGERVGPLAALATEIDAHLAMNTYPWDRTACIRIAVASNLTAEEISAAKEAA